MKTKTLRVVILRMVKNSEARGTRASCQKHVRLFGTGFGKREQEINDISVVEESF